MLVIPDCKECFSFCGCGMEARKLTNTLEYEKQKMEPM